MGSLSLLQGIIPTQGWNLDLPHGRRILYQLTSREAPFKWWQCAFPGLPSWLQCKEHTCQCRKCNRCGFDPWVEKIHWRKKWQIHSSILAWSIPWLKEPGKLESMGWHRVGHD